MADRDRNPGADTVNHSRENSGEHTGNVGNRRGLSTLAAAAARLTGLAKADAFSRTEQGLQYRADLTEAARIMKQHDRYQQALEADRKGGAGRWHGDGEGRGANDAAPDHSQGPNKRQIRELYWGQALAREKQNSAQTTPQQGDSRAAELKTQQLQAQLDASLAREKALQGQIADRGNHDKAREGSLAAAIRQATQARDALSRMTERLARQSDAAKEQKRVINEMARQNRALTEQNKTLAERTHMSRQASGAMSSTNRALQRKLEKMADKLERAESVPQPPSENAQLRGLRAQVERLQETQQRLSHRHEREVAGLRGLVGDLERQNAALRGDSSHPASQGGGERKQGRPRGRAPWRPLSPQEVRPLAPDGRMQAEASSWNELATGQRKPESEATRWNSLARGERDGGEDRHAEKVTRGRYPSDRERDGGRE